MTLSSSPLLLAVMAKLMSGAGKSMAGKLTASVSAQSVSPVITSLSLAMAPRSPATRSPEALLSLPIVLRIWPRRSLWPSRAMTTWESLLMVPWNTRNTLT